MPGRPFRVVRLTAIALTSPGAAVTTTSVTSPATVVVRATDDEDDSAEAKRLINYAPQAVPPPRPPTPAPVRTFGLKVGKLKPGATSVLLTGTFSNGGSVTATLSARVKQGKGRKPNTVALGTTRKSVTGKPRHQLSVQLNKTAKQLIAKLRTLTATLTVACRPGFETGTTKTASLTFKAKPPKKKRKKP